MKLLGYWLAESVCLAMAVSLGLLAMQAPNLAHDYATGLLQVAQEVEQDVADRFAAARRFYNLGDVPADQVMATLAAREPSNAETLGAAVTEAEVLRAAYARIETAPDLLRPFVMVIDAAQNGASAKARILRTSLQTFTPGLGFTTAAIVYGLAGLLVGRLLGGLVTFPLHRNKTLPI